MTFICRFSRHPEKQVGTEQFMLWAQQNSGLSRRFGLEEPKRENRRCNTVQAELHTTVQREATVTSRSRQEAVQGGSCFWTTNTLQQSRTSKKGAGRRDVKPGKVSRGQAGDRQDWQRQIIVEMSAGETCMWKRRAIRQCVRKQEELSGGCFFFFFILSSFFNTSLCF